MPSSFLHYDIIKKLGEGGMGVVYLARDTKLNRNVALKFLPKHISNSTVERRRFEIEAQAAAGLNHPNIAHVYAIEQVDDEPFIVLEYVEGKELKEVIDDGSLSFDDKLDIAMQIAKGIQTAHQKGIIHRDIKSRNIMFDGAETIKIMDFGLARLEGSDHITKTGTTIGTTAFMSPEQLRGTEADARSDIWSFGVVLYELFSGELPFRGLHEPAVMYSIMEEPPQPLKTDEDSIPGHIQAIIDKCLEKNPDDRYQSLSEILDDLRNKNPLPSKDSSKVSYFSAVNTRNLSIGVAMVAVFIAVLYFFQDGLSVFRNKVPDKRYLAVLPIENIGNNTEIQAICDGLAETFSFRLSELEQYEDSYWVTPASEIRKENVISASQANKMFGVNLAISASIQTVRDSTRLIIELVDADKVRRISTRQVVVHSDNLAMLEFNAVKEMLAMLEIDLKPNLERTIREGVPSNPKAYEYYLKGRASLQRDANLNDLNKAVEYFEQAVAMDSEFVLAYAGLGEAYWSQYEVTGNVKFVNLAETSLDLAISFNDQLAPVQFLFGLVKSGTGQYEESINYFERSLELDPKYTAAYREMANVYNEIGDTDRALEVYEKVIELKPDYWEGYKDLGVYHLSNGDFENAILNFERVVSITSNNSKAFSNLGIAYYYQGQNGKAREMFETSLGLDESPLTANNLAGLYFADRMYQKAASMYEIVLKEFPNRYEIWGNYAAAVDLSGNTSNAKQHYLTAIQKAKEHQEVNPNNPLVLADIGAYYSDLGERNDAINYIKKALAINDQNLFVRLRAVTIYENLGMRKNAFEWITSAMIEDIESQPELKDLVKDPVYIELKNQLVHQINN